MAYVAEYQRPYEGGYVDLPDESTPEMAAFINARDDALLKIEQFLANLDLSGLGSEYALLSEAGYSLGLSIDNNYVMSISLKNKTGVVLDSKNIDFPIESMVVNATYENGKIVLSLQNGNTLPIDISDMVKGLVPTTRKIAGIDLADDITKEKLKSALGLGGGASGEIPTKVSQLENDAGYITQEDITEAGSVSVGEIKPWLYDEAEEVVIGVYNGKPLYRKIFQIMVNCPANSFVTYKISDYVQNVDVINNCICRDEYDGLLYPVFFMNTGVTSSRSVIIAKREDFIYFTCDRDITLTDALHTFVMEYTKTTDAEGSGNDLKPYGIYDAKLDELASSKENIAITETTETTMQNSYDGRLKVDEIGGQSEQIVTTGKNLLNCRDRTSKNIDGVTFTPIFDANGNLQYIEANGTNAGEGYAIYGIPASFYTVGETYTLSGCPSGGNANSYFLQTAFFGTDYGQGYTGVLPSEVEANNEKKVNIFIAKGFTANKLRFYPMVRLASIADPTYEPYTGGKPSPSPEYPQEIKKTVVSGIKTRGKNYINNTATSQTINGVTFVVNDDGSVLVNGTATEHTSLQLDWDLQLSTGEYILSGCPSNGGASRYSLNVRGITNDFGASVTFSITEIKNVIVQIVMASGTVCNNLVFYPMLRKADVEDDTYEPYKESSITLSNPIDLYGKGDVQDVIKDGKVVRRFAEVVLDGSETWVLATNGLFYHPDAARIKSRGKALSDQYAYMTTLANPTVGYFDTAYGQLRFASSTEKTVEEWKERVTNNPITVIFELAEETTESLSTADQIALNSLETYDGITYLEFDSEVQPTFEGEYGTSKVGGMTLESLLTARNNDLRLSSLEASVVNNI